VAAYVEFFRNQPLLLLVYLVFYGIPSVGGFKYSPTVSFIITLTIYSAAYLVEIFRSGLDAVPKGQIDAGKAIGLTPYQRLLHVRRPTMFRVTLPALGNQFVSLFKDTSVAFVIAVPELTYAAKWLATNKFRIFEGYSILAPMYLVTCWRAFAVFAERACERDARSMDLAPTAPFLWQHWITSIHSRLGPLCWSSACARHARSLWSFAVR
jgi:polar amino acid transport system permease protein